MSSANAEGDATPAQMALENELYAAGAAVPDAYGGMQAAPMDAYRFSWFVDAPLASSRASRKP